MLTLTPAFPGADRQEVLSRVLSADPAPPRSLDRRIPRDLETVVLKAMEKDPGRRYQSAAEFAADLRRFLASEPVRARRAGVVDRVGKWSRRNRSLVRASAAVVLVGVAALAAGTVLIAGAYESEARHRKAAEDAAAEADGARRDALDREASLRAELYATEVRRAHEAWEYGDTPRLRELLDRHVPRPGQVDHRGFEWHYLDSCARAAEQPGRVLAGHEFPLLSADLSPDGRLVATSDKGGVVKLWDAASGRELRSARYSTQEVTCVRFSPDGRTLAAAGQDQTIRLWDVAGWSEVKCLRGHTRTVSGVCWSPNGKQLLSGGRDYAVVVWNAATGQVARSLVGHKDVVRCVAWSPDGKLVASAGPEPEVRLWDPATGKSAGTRASGLPTGALSLAFNPGGHVLAVGGYGNLVSMCFVRGAGSYFHIETSGTGWSVAFDPEGRRLLVGSDGWAEVWDTVAHPLRRVRAVPGDHRHRAVAFSRDGRTVLTAVEEGREARLTDVTALLGQNRRTLPGSWHAPHPATGVSLCEAEPGVIALGRHADGTLVGPVAGLDSSLWETVFSDTGRVMATSGDGGVQVWDTVTRRLTRELAGPGTQIPSLTISPDGALVAGGDQSGTAHVWRADTGERVAAVRVPDARGAVVRFSPDGSLLAVACKREVGLWRVGAWSRGLVLAANQEVNSLAFSPDGRTLAAGGSTRGAVLWDVASGRRVAVLGEQTGLNRDPTFSPDGRTLVTIAADSSVRLWHVPTRRELFTLYRHDAPVVWVRFESPHRLLVATHAHDRRATTVHAFPPLQDVRQPPSAVPATDGRPAPAQPNPGP